MSVSYFLNSNKGSLDLEQTLKIFFKGCPKATSCEVEHYKAVNGPTFGLAHSIGFHKKYYEYYSPRQKRLSLGIWRITPKPHILKQLRNNEI